MILEGAGRQRIGTGVSRTVKVVGVVIVGIDVDIILLLTIGVIGEVIVGTGTTGNGLTKRFKGKGQNRTTIGFEIGVEHVITNGFVVKFVRGTSCDVELEDLVVSDTVHSI